RDATVTGVQTCALPIFIWRYLVDPTKTVKAGKEVVIWRVDVVFLQKGDWKYEGRTGQLALLMRHGRGIGPPGIQSSLHSAHGLQIGRASCRERVWISVE